MTDTHIPLAELHGIKKKKNPGLSSFSRGHKPAKPGGYQAAELPAQAEAGSVTGAGDGGGISHPKSPGWNHGWPISAAQQMGGT